ncbi:MAG: AMP-binding protein, partial [Prevotella sp.]|nr:AMP-binding protein [Prevotella sp.]
MKTSAPTFEESKQWYAQNFDCSDTFSQLIPDLEGTEPKEGRLSRKMGVSLDAVEDYCKKHGIVKNAFFTAVYSYLLAKYNNDQEALFGIVERDDADGSQPEAFPVYAIFANDTTVLEFLKSVEEMMEGCREHSSYPIMDALCDLSLQIGSYFACNGHAEDYAELSVPLYVMVSAQDGNCLVATSYDANQYSEQLVSQFLESYEAVVEGFLNEEYLRDISIATKAQVELLDSFNNNDVAYDDTQTVVSLFCQQAKATPDNIAVVFKDKKYTYKEVDEISDRIAAYIVAKGLENEDVVSVLIPRCEWMAIASLGVLKAGCAYQPLDPSYPKERLNFMMQDAGAKLLIADEDLRDIVDEYKGEVLLTKDIEQLPALTEESRSQLSIINCQLKPEGLFIMLYTSGSTGVPKACQLEHGNLVCFCHWYQRYYELTADSHVAAYASYGFD